MAQVESDESKKLAKLCPGRVLVLLYPTLYRTLKLTFPTDVGGIVLDGRNTFDIGSGVRRLIVAEIAMNSSSFRIVAVSAPNDQTERVSFFNQLGDSSHLVLVGD